MPTIEVRGVELAWSEHGEGAPILLIHGAIDPTVPVEQSRELAARRPDLVTYEEFPGARHTQAWNRDPATR